VQLAIADSTYNAEDLRSEGFERTAVSPILVDFTEYDEAPRSRTLSRLRKEADGGHRWLFIGRLSPNKCQHDLIAAFAVYRRLFDPKARLSLVGGGPAPLYRRALAAMADELGLGDAVELADAVDSADALAHFAASDVLVCLSEHEGFNIPVLEAMHFGMPVVAYSCCAVPETVGDAGVLLADKDPVVVATAVDRVLTDDGLRSTLVAAGKRRVEHFSLANTSRRMLDTITAAVQGEEVLAGA
jgi:glycosyltransferase involved in cell wall biosynthesis